MSPARRPSPFLADTAFRDLAGEGGEWTEVSCGDRRVPQVAREFWTARQRQASRLHEISYRACYKPQLPRHFIEVLSAPGDLVYDPFSGRGTTVLEAALLGRRGAANDINPLSALLLAPRLDPPDPAQVAARLEMIPAAPPAAQPVEAGPGLSMFYHPDTEAEIRALRSWMLEREAAGHLDPVDAWIRMVATNRLTGHSAGFFSVYTLPPNQALSPAKQVLINRRLGQEPTYRDVRQIILKKSKQLLAGLDPEALGRLRSLGAGARLFTGDARSTPGLPDASVQLTVTSPPFLDVVHYAQDNWLRCWFNGLDAEAVGQGITMSRTVEAWSLVMGEVFRELFRVTRPGGFVAFEVGEVRKGTLRLEEAVLPLGVQAGFSPLGVLVNRQAFTKTANIWGVSNNERGTNSNRIAVFRKD